ncbi:hypothetical protein M3201_23885 [Paenibacillus motobuensis]|nr:MULTISPECIES: hypothetical protein [Paenibacillus]MCM3042700.1 hypothetical protein [Paenibacillus lutimineralis]MCM3649804.1 hypothetical protein [Paenibacillus motobuensis]
MKEKYWTDGVAEYAKRLGAYARVGINNLNVTAKKYVI